MIQIILRLVVGDGVHHGDGAAGVGDGLLHVVKVLRRRGDDLWLLLLQHLIVLKFVHMISHVSESFKVKKECTNLLVDGEEEEQGEDGLLQHGQELWVEAKDVGDGPFLGKAGLVQEL